MSYNSPRGCSDTSIKNLRIPLEDLTLLGTCLGWNLGLHLNPNQRCKRIFIPSGHKAILSHLHYLCLGWMHVEGARKLREEDSRVEKEKRFGNAKMSFRFLISSSRLCLISNLKGWDLSGAAIKPLKQLTSPRQTQSPHSPSNPPGHSRQSTVSSFQRKCHHEITAY
jgi:hypothetical protein